MKASATQIDPDRIRAGRARSSSATCTSAPRRRRVVQRRPCAAAAFRIRIGAQRRAGQQRDPRRHRPARDARQCEAVTIGHSIVRARPDRPIAALVGIGAIGVLDPCTIGDDCAILSAAGSLPYAGRHCDSRGAHARAQQPGQIARPSHRRTNLRAHIEPVSAHQLRRERRARFYRAPGHLTAGAGEERSPHPNPLRK